MSLNVNDGNIYARTKARLWLCSRKVFPNSLSLCNLKKTRLSVAFLWLFWGWDDPQVLQNLITEGKRNAYRTWINFVSLSADTDISRAFHLALERVPKWREMVGRRPPQPSVNWATDRSFETRESFPFPKTSSENTRYLVRGWYYSKERKLEEWEKNKKNQKMIKSLRSGSVNINAG